MSFRASGSALLFTTALLFAACGDSGTGTGGSPNNQGGAGGSTSNSGGNPSMGGAGGSGPSACETAQEQQNAKYAECGIDIGTPGTGGGGGGTVAECTAALGALAVCLKDCVLATPCGGLDGSDEEAATAFSACTLDC